MKLPIRKSVAIVADGSSASVFRHLHIPQEVYVIGVNHASIWLPRVNAYCTCFPDHRQRFLMNNQRQGVRYFAAVPSTYGSAFEKGEMYGPRERNVTFFNRTNGYGLDHDKTALRGGNSAFAAINLANHLNAKKIALFGVDLSDKPRVSGGIPSFPDVLDLFKSYDGSAEVVNGSMNSAIKNFPQLSPTLALEWLL